jgi:UDPglucose 6-dehydrogenase
MRIAVVGLGKLGAPLAAVLASVGHDVIGVDRNPATVAAINAGRAPVAEPGLDARLAMAAGRICATTDLAAAIRASALSHVILPTPSGPDGGFVLDHVLSAVNGIGAALRDGRPHVVNITSTVMPGATGGAIRAALETASGRRLGEGLGLTYNPEFIALGSVVRDLLQPDMVLIGQDDPAAGDVLAESYRPVVPPGTPVRRMNWVCAELTKLAVNTFVTTKISYANMIAELCERLPGADAATVAAALGQDSRIGAKYLAPALGYGGPCFPRDNLALAALARRLGLRAELAEATDAINRRQAGRVVALIARLAPTPTTIAVLGLAYKPGTPVVEESQGVQIAQALAAAGHRVLVADPAALATGAAALGDAAMPLPVGAAVAGAGLVVIATPDPEFAALSGAALAGKLVVDCWRVLPEGVADVVYLGKG